MQYDKTETQQVTELVTYVADPPPAPGQELKCVVNVTRGTMQITLTDPQLGAFVWEGLLVAAPVIYDLLGHVIADQASTLVPEEG